MFKKYKLINYDSNGLHINDQTQIKNINNNGLNNINDQIQEFFESYNNNLDVKYINEDIYKNISNQVGGLDYSMFTIRRKKKGKKYIYYYENNDQEVSEKDQNRINELIIPPAWTDVIISKDPKNPIQVIGVDSKGRKQYKYNEEHNQKSEKEKFFRLIEFIDNLPKLNENMERHSKQDIYSLNRVIVTMLKIVKLLHLRVGKEVYARNNKSYGISSLKKSHIKIGKSIIKFKFKSKSNKIVSYTIMCSPENGNDKHGNDKNGNDKNGNDIRDHLLLLMKLEGIKLFQYIDENNKIRKVSDTDINNYIKIYMGHQFTIKDFRTYAANWYFINSILKETRNRLPKNEKSIKKNIINSLKSTAYYLRHTRAISKKSYVMNFAIDLYQTNPSYFVDRKNSDTNTILYDILKLYTRGRTSP